jgi:hypothetical protein
LALKCLRGKEAMKPPSCEIKKEGLLHRSVVYFRVLWFVSTRDP